MRISLQPSVASAPARAQPRPTAVRQWSGAERGQGQKRKVAAKSVPRAKQTWTPTCACSNFLPIPQMRFLIIHPGYSIVGQRLALQEADPLLGEAELADAATGHC